MLKHWMFKYILILIMLFATSFIQEHDIKTWEKNAPLTWEDFRGSAKKNNSRSVANTVITEDYVFRRKGKDTTKYDFEFATRSIMNRSRSHADPAHKSVELLSHEQLHFDISEYFARQLLVALQNAKYTMNYKIEMRDIKRRIAEQRDVMEILYDNETEHSLNRTMQSKWNNYVAELLLFNPNIDISLNKLPRKEL